MGPDPGVQPLAFLATDDSGLWAHFPRRHISFEWEVSQAHIPDPKLALLSQMVIESFGICLVCRYRMRKIEDYKAQPWF